MQVWIDVDDLMLYARHWQRPSGIQRLAYELCRELRELRGERVRFVRHAAAAPAFAEVEWETIEDLFRRLTGPAPEPEPEPPDPAKAAPAEAARPLAASLVRPITARLPERLRRPLGEAVWYSCQGARALARIGRPVVPPAAPDPDPALAAARLAEATGIDRFEAAFAPGDVLLALGSPWSRGDYADLLGTALRPRGGWFGALIYDLIPVRRPEWCDRALVAAFRHWFASVLPRSDVLFAISHATARDLERYAAAERIRIPAPRVIPVGTGFRPDAAPPAPPRADMPPPGSYVLVVSTIEARKNHAMLFRIWRRMLEDTPAGELPTLVFAGRVGWLVADLMQQLENADWLGGKVRLIEGATDAELALLYEGALFTMFPSLYEGWGLPVSESLSFGKPCLIADNSSLPEAGGTLARYFDADDIPATEALIRATLRDRAGLAAWAARIRAEFRPRSWRDAALTILDHLEHATAAGQSRQESRLP